MDNLGYLTIVFEIVVTAGMLGLVPWASRVTRELGEIKTTLAERERHSTEIVSLTKRVVGLEIHLAGLGRNHE